MAIKKDEVRHIAQLARLQLSDKEIEYFSEQLDRILAYIDQLKEVDTAEVEAMSHAIVVQNIVHEDIAGQSLEQKDALKGAPESESGLFKVPRIIEES